MYKNVLIIENSTNGLKKLNESQEDLEVKIGTETQLAGGRVVRCYEDIQLDFIENVLVLVPTGKEVSYDDISYD